jgi:hypothetical protein
MKKLYYHGGVVLQEGRAVCSICGVEVDDDLLSEKPCGISTAYYIVFDELPEYADVYWVISVSNFRAALLAGKQVPGGMRYESVSAKDEYLAEQLEDFLLASVEASGGARNISGFYGISDKLANLLRDWLADEKIILDC